MKVCPSTYNLKGLRTPCIQHKHVGVKDLPRVHLELDIAEVGVVDHRTEIFSQQPQRGLQEEHKDKGYLPVP